MAQQLTYKDSGVDIKKANTFVKSLKGLVRPASIEGFGSVFAFDKKKYRQPVLVSSTDGVGTKLMIAQRANIHNTVGIDAVAMNVNDILCLGARPLFFLDYIACGRVRPGVLKSVVAGIAEGCRQAGCPLIGGETAEMPGIYKDDDYDIAGFAVGVVEKQAIIDGSAIRPGDCILGLASNGIHSNGYSLVRKVFSPVEQKKMARELLKPTRIYVRPVLAVIGRWRIKGVAHITGGAFYEKLTKIIPQGACANIDATAWPVPGIFRLIQRKGNIADKEMFTTFNMGIGMVLIVSKKDAVRIKTFLARRGVLSWEIGEIVRNDTRKIII